MRDKPRNLWNSSVALQIPTVDAQHKVLFDLAYEVDCAIYEGKEQAVADRVVERLKEFCQHHFLTEERLMQEHGYPELHRHTLQHDDFISAILELDMQQKSGAKVILQRIAALMREWMANHIAVEDRKFAPVVLRQNSVQCAAGTGVPVLIEVLAAGRHADTALCPRVAGLLMQKGIRPVGLADSLDQTRTILEELRPHQLTPAIFVVNTFGARDILMDLDPLMGDLPVLYLRRALFAGQSGVLDQMNRLGPGSPTATAALGKMKPRLSSMWFYGAKNADAVATRAAEALGAFLCTGDFREIEHRKPANEGRTAGGRCLTGGR